jgi:hypothetical protein
MQRFGRIDFNVKLAAFCVMIRGMRGRATSRSIHKSVSRVG